MSRGYSVIGGGDSFICRAGTCFAVLLVCGVTAVLLLTFVYNVIPVPSSSGVPTAMGSGFPLIAPLPLVVESRADVAYKQIFMNAGAWTTIAEYSGGQGVIQRIWLAVNVAPNDAFIAVVFDGASTPQIGSLTLNEAITAEVMFTPGFGSYQNFQSDLFGCNNYAAGTFGGYFTLPMPFNQSFTIQLYGTVALTYWVQVFFDSYPNQDAVIPLYFYLQMNSAMVSYPSETPLLSMAAPRGVHLKYLKWFFSGVAGNWWEGRFKVYKGGTGMPAAISSVHYTDSTYTVITPYAPNSTILLVSTGTEDFFQSSWNFWSSEYYANQQAGYLWSSTGPLVVVWITSAFSAYRVFPTPLSSAPDEYLVFSYSVGDALVGASGQGAFTALVGYYS